MSILPSLFVIEPFDAKKGAKIYYSFTGSMQATINHLVITNVSNGEIVYSFEYNSFEKMHPVPPNALKNGMVYKAKIRVKFADDSYSPYSGEAQFRTLETPILDIDNIDGLGHVYNKDVTFIATYSQANGERVKSYRFSLYDENEDLIENYPVRIPRDQASFTEVVEGLEKGKSYFIDCRIETVNGFIWSHRERFIPLYLVPSVNGVIQTVADNEDGFVRINANLKQITGTQVKGTAKDTGLPNYDSDNYQYINDEWIVIPKDRPVIFTGLDMNRASDFVMKIWCKSLPDGKVFAELSPKGDEEIAIRFYKYSNRIVAEKTYKGVTARYVSNIATIPTNSEYMVYVKAVEHRLDITLRLL